MLRAQPELSQDKAEPITHIISPATFFSVTFSSLEQTCQAKISEMLKLHKCIFYMNSVSNGCV